MDLRPIQENVLRALWQAARLLAFQDRVWRDGQPVRVRYWILVKPCGDTSIYPEGQGIEELREQRLLDGKEPPIFDPPTALGCIYPVEWKLTDKGAKSLGHDTAAARRVERVR